MARHLSLGSWRRSGLGLRLGDRFTSRGSSLRTAIAPVALATIFLAVTAPAAAASPVASAAPAPGPVPAATLAEPAASVAASSPPPLGLAVSLGVRTDIVRSAGFDPFSSADDLQELSLAVRFLNAPERALGFAVGVSWDHGQSSASARAATADLTVDRLSLALEGRVPVSRHVTLLARVAPGLLRRSATLHEGSLPNAPFSTSSFGIARQSASTISVDGGVGIEFLVGRLQTAALPVVGLSLLADGGYSYSPAREVVLSSGTTSAVARNDDPLRFGSLTIGGFFFRLAAALSF